MRLKDVADGLNELGKLISSTQQSPGPYQFKAVSLGDVRLFRLSIGKRVLKKELFGRERGPIPLYSANVAEPFGHIEESNIKKFSRPSVLWG